jgi:hypothetical protein
MVMIPGVLVYMIMRSKGKTWKERMDSIRRTPLKFDEASIISHTSSDEKKDEKNSVKDEVELNLIKEEVNDEIV